MTTEKTIVLANPRGFCAGVDRAIEIVERVLETYGAPVYVRHEIVHNTYVVDRLKRHGAIFIEDIDKVPEGAILIFSAHGVPKAVVQQARSHGLKIYDATCPLVTKVHVEVMKMQKEGLTVVMIGHAGHPEVEGTLGQLKHGIELVQNIEDVAALKMPSDTQVGVVTQTTLSVDDTQAIMQALIAKYSNLRQPKQQDICYATQNRQDAVKQLAKEVDIVIVVGSPTSSNSNRLREVAERSGVEAYMVDSAADINFDWLHGKTRVGLTAGASAPEVLVQEVIKILKLQGFTRLTHQDGEVEKLRFPLPMGLGTLRQETSIK